MGWPAIIIHTWNSSHSIKIFLLSKMSLQGSNTQKPRGYTKNVSSGVQNHYCRGQGPLQLSPSKERTSRTSWISWSEFPATMSHYTYRKDILVKSTHKTCNKEPSIKTRLNVTYRTGTIHPDGAHWLHLEIAEHDGITVHISNKEQ